MAGHAIVVVKDMTLLFYHGNAVFFYTVEMIKWRKMIRVM